MLLYILEGSDSVNETVSNNRLTARYIQRFGLNNKIENEFQSYCREHENSKDGQIKKYITEVDIWNKLYRELYDESYFEAIDSIQDNVRISTLLVTTEVFIQNLHAIINHKEVPGFPYLNTDFAANIDNKVVRFSDIDNDVVELYMNNMYKGISKVINATVNFKYRFKNKESDSIFTERVFASNLVANQSHFTNIDKKGVLDEALDQWRFFNASVVSKSNQIKISYDNLYKNRIISELRQSNQYMTMEQSGKHDDGKKYFSELIGNQEPLHQKELFHLSYAKEYFHIGDINKNIEGVAFYDWHRAYSYIVSISKIANRKFSFKRSYLFDDIIIAKSEQEWLNELTSVGLSSESAVKVFKTLILQKNSIDILDCPFIDLGNEQYAIIPALSKIILPAKSMESIFTREELDISFKGNTFEIEVRNILDNLNIPNFSLSESVNGETYEVDLIFTLGEDVFICELKNLSHPGTTVKQYQFLNTNKDHARQLNRIFGYYEKRENLIKEKTGIEQINSLTKLIIYSNKVWKVTEVIGCHIIDKSILLGYIESRIPRAIDTRNQQTILFATETLKRLAEEEKSLKGLLEYFEEAPMIEYYKGNIKLKKMNISFGDYDVEFPKRDIVHGAVMEIKN